MSLDSSEGSGYFDHSLREIFFDRSGHNIPADTHNILKWSLRDFGVFSRR